MSGFFVSCADKASDSVQSACMSDYTNFKSLKRPPKPNTCLVAPDDYCLAAKPDWKPPETDLSTEDLFARFKAAISGEKSWGKLSADPKQGKLKFVATTGLMRFKDDIDIEVIPLSDQRSTFAIYSRSRIGYSDLGANRKRVHRIIEKVTTN